MIGARITTREQEFSIERGLRFAEQFRRFPHRPKVRRGDWQRLTSSESFREYARDRRIELGISVALMAYEIQKSRSWVYAFEAGRITPNLDAAIAVAAVLNCHVFIEVAGPGVTLHPVV